jgi:hypothetical protein
MAFTEHGVLMLSSILNSKQAISVNIQIMRIFAKVRQMFADTLGLNWRLKKSRRNFKIRIKILNWFFVTWMN